MKKDQFYANFAKDILTYVDRDLGHKSGAFFSAEDADSAVNFEPYAEKQEGAFCTWTFDEVRRLLDKPITNQSSKTIGDMFCKYYTVLKDGNVDPSSVIFSKSYCFSNENENSKGYSGRIDRSKCAVRSFDRSRTGGHVPGIR